MEGSWLAPLLTPDLSKQSMKQHDFIRVLLEYERLQFSKWLQVVFYCSPVRGDSALELLEMVWYKWLHFVNCIKRVFGIWILLWVAFFIDPYIIFRMQNIRLLWPCYCQLWINYYNKMFLFPSQSLSFVKKWQFKDAKT